MNNRLEKVPLVSRRSRLSWMMFGVFGMFLWGTVVSSGADIKRFLSPSNLPKRAVWHHSYSKAVAAAKKEQRPIVLLFTGEEWCKPCKYLERRVFMKNEFHQWALKNVVLAKINLSREFKPTVFNIFERKAHDGLLQKYRVRTIPSAIILTPAEQPLGMLRFKGQSAREYIAAAQRIVQRRQAGLSLK